MRRLGVVGVSVLALLTWAPTIIQAADAHVRLIRGIVRPELDVPNVAGAVAQVLAEGSSCVPRGGVVLSVTNKHHARLRTLQFALIKHRRCFMKRVVSVCFNNVSDAFGTCVQSTVAIPPSDFRRSNYANLIWAKWRIVADALQVARLAMWFDADVVILRNPWATLKLLGGPPPSATYDIRYQSEPPPLAGQSESCAPPVPVCAGCAGINGGQLLVRSAKIAQRMYAARPRNLSNVDRLDQDWADALINNGSRNAHLLGGRQSRPSFSSCVLPEAFAAQCWSSASFARSAVGRRRKWDPARDLGCSQTTHHFNCVPNRRDKSSMMGALIESWKRRCGNHSADSDDWRVLQAQVQLPRDELHDAAAALTNRRVSKDPTLVPTTRSVRPKRPHADLSDLVRVATQ